MVTTSGPATQFVLAFEDNRLASTLFGQYGQNLALLERRLGVVAEQRGNHVTLAGPRDGVEQARRVLETLYERLKQDATPEGEKGPTGATGPEPQANYRRYRSDR